MFAKSSSTRRNPLRGDIEIDALPETVSETVRGSATSPTPRSPTAKYASRAVDDGRKSGASSWPPWEIRTALVAPGTNDSTPDTALLC